MRLLSDDLMDNTEAIDLLERELERFRGQSYAQLMRRIPEDALVYERSEAGGKKYQVEVQFLCDDRPGGNIRVMGSIDDGGWRAVLPLTRSFIKPADDSSVGE